MKNKSGSLKWGIDDGGGVEAFQEGLKWYQQCQSVGWDGWWTGLQRRRQWWGYLKKRDQSLIACAVTWVLSQQTPLSLETALTGFTLRRADNFDWGEQVRYSSFWYWSWAYGVPRLGSNNMSAMMPSTPPSFLSCRRGLVKSRVPFSESTFIKRAAYQYGLMRAQPILEIRKHYPICIK